MSTLVLSPDWFRREREDEPPKGIGWLGDVFSKDRFYSVQQIAERLLVSTGTLYEAIHAGELMAFRIGRIYRVLGQEINKWLGAVGGFKCGRASPYNTGQKNDYPM